MQQRVLGALGRSILVVTAAALMVTAHASATVSAARVQPIWSAIQDKGGNPITSSTPGETLLFTKQGNNPVLAPDGHQVTTREFNAVQGSASVKCNRLGTHTIVHLTGLIPNGVYTVWLVTFGPSGPPAAAVGALGEDKDGNGNVIFADRDGEGDLSVTNRPGPLTARGSVGACWLTDEFQVLVDGVYHIDGSSHGRGPGPAGTWVDQFGFRFRQTDHLTQFVRDSGGSAITDSTSPDTPVFESSQMNPVLAPDGHQLTLREYNGVQGAIDARCTAKGTHIRIQLNGLVPDGIYTVWLLTFKSPGGAANIIGVGGAGDNNVVANVIVADENGEGDLVATKPGGPLSVKGAIGACFLTDEFETEVVGAYHIDGNSHGPSPGPAGTSVNQFAFRFNN